MALRFLVFALALSAVGVSAQVGPFGPVSDHPAAGELAPALSYDKLLSAPEGVSWTATNLSGRLTVIGFFGNTSLNPKTVTQWNATVDQFAAKNVQFVWITDENESSLIPWLADHPLKGFVMLDVSSTTARSYGIEMPVAVIVGADGGMDFWSLQGFDVKGVISMFYDVNPIRVELPISFRDGERYDFSMVLPKSESTKEMTDRFRQALQDYYHLNATREVRFMDVYVVTNTDLKPRAIAASSDQGGGMSFGSLVEAETSDRTKTDDPNTFTGFRRTITLNQVRGISLGGTIDQFCRTLEQGLDRPVINETNLKGKFSISVKSDEPGDFLSLLRQKTGLVVTPAQRNVEILVFNPR